MEVVPTPGHTPEHISFLATDTSKDAGPHALFSGGALMVGGVARTDMLGEQVAPFLSRWFYRTIRQELQRLNDEVVVYTTLAVFFASRVALRSVSVPEASSGKEATPTLIVNFHAAL